MCRGFQIWQSSVILTKQVSAEKSLQMENVVLFEH